MENIGIETLEHDRDYFRGKLEEAQREYQNIQNLLVHLEGILTYNEQLIRLLEEKPQEVTIVKKEETK